MKSYFKLNAERTIGGEKHPAGAVVLLGNVLGLQLMGLGVATRSTKEELASAQKTDKPNTKGGNKDKGEGDQ